MSVEFSDGGSQRRTKHGDVQPRTTRLGAATGRKCCNTALDANKNKTTNLKSSNPPSQIVETVAPALRARPSGRVTKNHPGSAGTVDPDQAFMNNPITR
jgi:hypothetical protein